MGKDKAGQLAVVPVALSCLRRALPSEMPLPDLVHTLAKYTLHLDKGKDRFFLVDLSLTLNALRSCNFQSRAHGGFAGAASYDEVPASAESNDNRAIQSCCV